MKRHLLGVAGTVLSLCACAPPGYVYDTGSFVPHARDACARPETASGLVSFLNAQVGRPNGPPSKVLSIQGLVSAGQFVSDGDGQYILCHGTLNLASGENQAGNVRVVELDSMGPIISGGDSLIFQGAESSSAARIQVSWESDADLAKQEAARVAASRTQDWRSFHGDIATWTGIPPLPPSASTSTSPRTPVSCTVADAADHMVTIWATRRDCDKWIKEAKNLAKSGPTRMQIESYKREQCIHRLSTRMTQSYSGEFIELCSGSIRP